MMTEFKLCGDLIHLIALIYLLQHIWRKKTCKGISGMSQLLMALMVTARFIPTVNFISIYNTAGNVILTSLVFATLVLIFYKHHDSYERKYDSFWCIILLVVPWMILANFANHSYELLEIFWAFSMYLEVVVMFPQMLMIIRRGYTERPVYFYLILLTVYRSLYIANWAEKYLVWDRYDLISFISGIVQVLLQIAFLIFYLFKSDKATVGVDKPHNIFIIDEEHLIEKKPGLEKSGNLEFV